MRRFLWLPSLVFLSCDLIEKAGADKILVVTWVNIPAVSTPPFNLIPDIGATTVTAIFADAKNPTSPVPVTGAFAAFFGVGKLSTLPGTQTPGTYSQNSTNAPDLVYDDNPEHRFGFEACATESAGGCVGTEYDIDEILAAPVVDKNTLALSPALTAPDLPNFDGALAAGTSLTVQFPPAPEGEEYRPIVEVFGTTESGPGLVYSSLPTSVTDLVGFLNETPPTSLTIDGSNFLPGAYVVAAASLRLSLDTSTNLFIGSGALAASANVFLIEVE